MNGKVKLEIQWEYFKFSKYLSNEDKLRFIGKYFDSKKIIDVAYLDRPNYIWNGWAFLVDDGYWCFSCPLDFIHLVEVYEMSILKKPNLLRHIIRKFVANDIEFDSSEDLKRKIAQADFTSAMPTFVEQKEFNNDHILSAIKTKIE